MVVLGLSGVQKFIQESRTTADVASASQIIQDLATVAARRAGELGVDLIYPVLDDDRPRGGVTSKIAFLADEGAGPGLAKEVADAVHREWRQAAAACFGAAPPTTPGMPNTWWVAVTGPADTPQEYAALRERAENLATARKRTRVFEVMTASGVWPCAVSPGLPSVLAPDTARRHERGERLSAACWVKRTYLRDRGGQATRSTLSIASTPYRVELLKAAPDDLAAEVAALLDAAATVVGRSPSLPAERPVVTGVPAGVEPLATSLGAWVYPDVWNQASLHREYRTNVAEDTVRQGRAAALAIGGIAERLGIRRPTPYYAVLLQDLDRLGAAMGALGRDQQGTGSQQLVELGRAQRRAIENAVFPGVPVYTGGDDLLAFAPAAGAITLAAEMRALVDEHLKDGPLRDTDGRTITASTAVVFAHMRSPLRSVLSQARDALDKAKNSESRQGQDRDALTVVVLRRGGERSRLIQPWSPQLPSRLARLTPARFALSSGLAGQLEQDKHELAGLAEDTDLHPTVEAELTRLVLRRTRARDDAEAGAVAQALHQLAWDERGEPDAVPGTPIFYRPAEPALVARFLAQECGVRA
ncbi:CRISPR-associated protein Cmr2 [Kutzneria buriramensis]|uniref:CRISPR-associated protein Cmr2 n=2 Tax=Kutzneria buriramensis TaxID=1045776 RepID=A0A3E0HLS1_9PSEU|nr:CRISPR-associated protein Cmr2 [Kutzneria buriramensis]